MDMTNLSLSHRPPPYIMLSINVEENSQFRTLFLSILTFGLSDSERRGSEGNRHYSISLMDFNTVMETTAGQS